ncbi:MAG: hypothetical protein U1F07_16390 [Rubrivivax sp.]
MSLAIPASRPGARRHWLASAVASALLAMAGTAPTAAFAQGKGEEDRRHPEQDRRARGLAPSR